MADAHLDVDQHSLLVMTTTASHVRLVRHQAQRVLRRGVSRLVFRDRVTESTAVSASQRNAFWADVQAAGAAVTAAFDPRKVDYLVMGHRMPHLHCHVFPQHEQDDPKRNVDIFESAWVWFLFGFLSGGRRGG